MTEGEICEIYAEPEFAEAAGVLEMIRQTPEHLQEYRARMKFEMDEIARVDYARLEGEQRGEQRGDRRGELFGHICVLQELLSISEPSREELSTYDNSRMDAFGIQLQKQLRARGLPSDNSLGR